MLRKIVFFVLLLSTPFGLLESAPVTLSPESSEFRVDVKATGHSFEVLLDSYTAAIEVAETGVLEKADFSFAVVDLVSDNKKRDKKMLDWLESDSIPQIGFTLKEVQQQGAGMVGIGDLTMHGVTRSVEVPFTAEVEGDQVTLQGTAVVDHTNYDLDVITMFFMKVNPELKVSFKLVGTLAE